MAESTKTRDGFVIRDFDGNEVHFVACSYDSERMREKVMLGLLTNMRDDLILCDTREEDEAATAREGV